MRIDGDTEICLREQMCVDFNKDASVFCALLTTKVGGQGLNLTGADRAIILDLIGTPQMIIRLWIEFLELARKKMSLYIV